MRARITITKNGRHAFVYEIRDERGMERASGWCRGTQQEARQEAREHAAKLGLEVL